MEGWRRQQLEDKQEYQTWVNYNIQKRWAVGIKRYQSDIKGFIGDPIDQAIEECFDALFYLWMAKRQRDNKQEGE